MACSSFAEQGEGGGANNVPTVHSQLAAEMWYRKHGKGDVFCIKYDTNKTKVCHCYADAKKFYATHKH